MSATRPAYVRQALRELDLRPSKRLGQNFLIDRNIRDSIIAASEVGDSDAVVEVGPGLGALTEALVEQAGRVAVVEKDGRLFQHIRDRFADAPNFSAQHADALDVDLIHAPGRAATRFVSNLPYSSGSRILADVVRGPKDELPGRMVVTVQREVADRMAAAPGSKDYGMLSLWLQLDYTLSRLRNISGTCFYPVPGVQSAVAQCVRRPQRLLEADADRARYFDLSKRLFAQRRKQVITTLRVGGLVSDEGLAAAAEQVAQRRPEDLSVEDWCALARLR